MSTYQSLLDLLNHDQGQKSKRQDQVAEIAKNVTSALDRTLKASEPNLLQKGEVKYYPSSPSGEIWLQEIEITFPTNRFLFVLEYADGSSHIEVKLRHGNAVGPSQPRFPSGLFDKKLNESQLDEFAMAIWKEFAATFSAAQHLYYLTDKEGKAFQMLGESALAVWAF